MHSTAGEEAEPTVSVVLCVRNGAATLDRQLAALSAQEYDEPWEIVLVDNASTDETGSRATAWTAQVSWLRVIEEPKIGLNRARNCGVRAARAGRLVLCDADDEVAAGWLRAMVTALSQFDIVGGALEPDVGVGLRSPSSDCPQRSELPTVFDRPYALGASMGFVRQAFDAVGGFDEQFTLGADEVDFCLCAQDAGSSIGFAPEARARYRAKQTTGDIVRQGFGYGRGHQRLVAKHAALGRIHSRPAERWKSIGTSAGSLVKDAPELLRRSTRSAYLARLAHVVGEVTELAGTKVWRPSRESRTSPLACGQGNRRVPPSSGSGTGRALRRWVHRQHEGP